MSFSKPAVKRKVDEHTDNSRKSGRCNISLLTTGTPAPTCPICTEKVACRGGLAIWRTGHMPGGPLSIGSFWGAKNAPKCPFRLYKCNKMTAGRHVIHQNHIGDF